MSFTNLPTTTQTRYRRFPSHQKVPLCHFKQPAHPSPQHSFSAEVCRLRVDVPILELLINGLKVCVPFSVCLFSLNTGSEIHPCCKCGWSVSCSLLSSILLWQYTTVYAFLLIDPGLLTGGALSVSLGVGLLGSWAGVCGLCVSCQVLFQMTAWNENSHCFPSQPTLRCLSF